MGPGPIFKSAAGGQGRPGSPRRSLRRPPASELPGPSPWLFCFSFDLFAGRAVLRFSSSKESTVLSCRCTCPQNVECLALAPVCARPVSSFQTSVAFAAVAADLRDQIGRTSLPHLSPSAPLGMGPRFRSGVSAARYSPGAPTAWLRASGFSTAAWAVPWPAAYGNNGWLARLRPPRPPPDTATDTPRTPDCRSERIPIAARHGPCRNADLDGLAPTTSRG